jgi:ubiquinone/menaquinone biosynthesis C-methylase UbiE
MVFDQRIKQLLPVGGSIVDLGCGSGEMLDEIDDLFEERIGIDISRNGLAQREVHRWTFIEADLNSAFPLRNNWANAIIANQVIEHIVDPIGFVREIYRVLRPDGICIVTTPNIRYLKNIWHLLLSGYGPRTAGCNTIDGVWDVGHLHYFTHRDLRELFAKAGFTKIKSYALIDLTDGGIIRLALDRAASAWPVREFLSGNILFTSSK